MENTDIYERDEISLLPLTDEQKETFYCLTRDGFNGNFKPVLKYSHEELEEKIDEVIGECLDNLSKKDSIKLKSFISSVLLKKFFSENGDFDLESFDLLQKQLSDDCKSVLDAIIDKVSLNVLKDGFVDLDDFFDKDGFVNIYGLCDSCYKALVDELERLDNTYSFSYSDDDSQEEDDVKVRYKLLLKDLEYLEGVLESASLLNDQYVSDLYEEEKSKCSIGKYIKVASIYAKASVKLIDGDIEDVRYTCSLYKELSKNRIWKKTLSHKFRKQLDRFIKDYMKNGAF